MNTRGGSPNNESLNELNDQSRPNSLKNRIKQRAMAMDCDGVNEVHVSSVLAAASALASLGNQRTSNTPPSTPEAQVRPAGGDRKLSLDQMMMGSGSSRAPPGELDQDVPMTFPQKVSKTMTLPLDIGAYGMIWHLYFVLLNS